MLLSRYTFPTKTKQQTNKKTDKTSNELEVTDLVLDRGLSESYVCLNKQLHYS